MSTLADGLLLLSSSPRVSPINLPPDTGSTIGLVICANLGTHISTVNSGPWGFVSEITDAGPRWGVCDPSTISHGHACGPSKREQIFIHLAPGLRGTP